MWSDGHVLDERYELSRRLGRGAMGDVWLAYDRRSRRAVAVKGIHRELLDPRHPEELIRRFTLEADLLARWKHPGIPAFLDARVDSAASDAYLVMEHVLGRDLTQVIADGHRLSEDEVVSLAVQICDVLEHTHAIPVIHRDLKPANIMLTDHHRVVVLDFGVAKVFRTDQARLTQNNRVLGTVAYMSPEQCEGRDVHPRSDLYSLACVLYELLTGIPPFGDADVARVMHCHRYQTPEPVSLLCPDVSPALEAVIMAGLAKQASDRPATAGEFRRQLESPHEPPAMCPPASSRSLSPLAAPDGPALEMLPIAVRIISAQALFEEGLIAQAMPMYARLAQDLADLGPEHFEDAVRCRFGLARCQRHLGYQEEALKALSALTDELQSRSPDDRLLLEVRFHIGQLLLDLGDEHGITELAEVFRTLTDAARPEDAAITADVRRALTRAALG
ncbi:serine/threonine-protein kinase [Streptomyces sp. NPDC005406]|uniref:serine/threonine-protein kinase n=1 Tax=Streptomyces sp. NPDC005406 TaxID=3155339 RepID=UPI0034525F73